MRIMTLMFWVVSKQREYCLSIEQYHAWEGFIHMDKIGIFTFGPDPQEPDLDGIPQYNWGLQLSKLFLIYLIVFSK